jgi:dipeptidyl aminopeptidase/acylaminoacyl peptidase
MTSPFNVGGEMLMYPGEGHGWARPQTVTDELERVDAFLTRWVLHRALPKPGGPPE